MGYCFSPVLLGYSSVRLYLTRYAGIANPLDSGLGSTAGRGRVRYLFSGGGSAPANAKRTVVGACFASASVSVRQQASKQASKAGTHTLMLRD